MPASCISAAAQSATQSRALVSERSARYMLINIISTLCFHKAGRCSRINVSLKATEEGSGMDASGARRLSGERMVCASLYGRTELASISRAAALSDAVVSAPSTHKWVSTGSRNVCCTSRSYTLRSMRMPSATSLMPLSL